MGLSEASPRSGSGGVNRTRVRISRTSSSRESGRTVEGGPDEATELWTFLRSPGGRWILSAIQQGPFAVAGAPENPRI